MATTKTIGLHFAPIDASDTDVVVIDGSLSGYPRTKVEADGLIRVRQTYLQALVVLQYKLAYQFRLYVAERQPDDIEPTPEEHKQTILYYDGLLDLHADSLRQRELYI